MNPPFPDIAGYTIERVIGQGGMATVYLARQLSLDRLVAIKLMVPEASAEETQAQRFEAEARVIARLEHPHIVGIHEVGRTDEGQLYYVMPYLPNGDLAHRSLSGDEWRIVEILHALLDALGYAHARGIVHRDVKAENVLFDSANRPRLADFGIALSRRTGKPRITTDGLTLGSSGYMAPEQARGETLDGRADLYSVGVLTYELLTGELPYHSEDSLALALMHDQDPVPRLPSEKCHWQAFVDRAMAKKPDHRYRNATAMLRALGQVEKSIRRRMRGNLLGDAMARIGATRMRPWALVGGGVIVAFAIALGVAALREPAPKAESAPRTPAPIEPATPDTQATVAQLLDRAHAQIESGDLVEPAGDNAAESVLAVLRIEPLNDDARAALNRVFDALADRVVAGLDSEDLDASDGYLAQTRLLADALGELGAEAIARVGAEIEEAALGVASTALDDGDASRADALLALLERHALPTDAVAAMLAAHREQPQVGARLSDPGAPTLRFLPASLLVGQQRSQVDAEMLAMEQPVTLAEFGAFVRASGHEVGRCRALLSPLRLVDQRSWEEPGFSQALTDPVVCIAHADAEAYAAWLTRRTGHRYRLPSVREQQHIALVARSRLGGRAFSTVAEWTADCSPGRDGSRDCASRTALDPGLDGRRWPLEPRELDGGRGYDDVGFRLVRETERGLPQPLSR